MKRIIFLLIAVITVVPLVIGCSSPSEKPSPTAAPQTNPAERIWAEIVPEEGAGTLYGMPLSMDNTQQFIDWNSSITLTSAEEKIKDGALEPLAAVCCDEFSIRTC